MDPHSFIARAEAQRWLGIAEKLLMSHDLVGSKTFAIRARDSDPRLEAADQILAIADTLLAAEKRVVGNNGAQQPDYYAILQLVRFVQETDHIAEQYRRLAVVLNPNQNRFPYSDQAFQLVNEAWTVLSNPMRKSLYDSELDFAPQQQQQQMNIGFNLEQQHHQQPQQQQHPQQHQHHQQQQHNFFSINQEIPESPQTFQNRLQQSHQQQQQQLQQHNFLSQPNSNVREQDHLFQHREQEQLFQPQVQPFQVTSPPHQQARPSPQPRTPLHSPPAAASQPPFSWQQEHMQQQQQQLQHKQIKQEQHQHQHLQQEQLKQQQLRDEQIKQQKLQQEQLKQQQIQQEQLKQQRMHEEQLKQQRLQEEQLKQQRMQEEQLKQQRLQEEQLKQQRIQEEQLKQQRLQEEQLRLQQLQQEQLKQQNLQQEQLKQQQMLQEQQKQQRTQQEQQRQQQSLNQNAAPVHLPTQVNSNNGVREEETVPETEVEPETEAVDENDDDSPTFWTSCPYCFYMYEYPKLYADCTLRCDNCKRAFQAVRISSPPPIVEGQDAYFCCWGFIPVGVSMSHLEKDNSKGPNSNWTPFSPLFDASKNVHSHLNEFAAPKKNTFVNKSSGPRIYFDDITDDSSDIEWDRPKKNNLKRMKKVPDPGFKKRIKVLALMAVNVRNGSVKNMKHGIPVKAGVGVRVEEISKKVVVNNPTRQSGRVAKESGKLDLNVEFNNNEGEEPARRMSTGTPEHGDDEEDNIEGIGFFEGLDDFFSGLPILSVVNEEKVTVA